MINLINATVYDENFDEIKANICVDGQHIYAISDSLLGETFDLKGLYLLPGLIDIHIHGAGGGDTGDMSVSSLEKMSLYLAGKGVTSFCPTTMTEPINKLLDIFTFIKENKDNVSGSYIQGINMEGPYLSKAKKGAQNEEHLKNPDVKEFTKLYKDSGKLIKIVSVAPELWGALEFAQGLSGVCRVAIGHTNADYETAVKVIENGADHITHLYNAMSGFSHRAPGVVGAVFDKGGSVTAELICDGVHIHPAAVRTAFKILGEDSCVIVSDAMSGAGISDGEYEFGGQTVYVKKGSATLKDGTIAASTTNMLKELQNAISFGVNKKAAIKGATINPAKVIGVADKTGSIRVGKYADLIAVDKNFNLKMVMIKGKLFNL